ncbi:anti-sigma factor antagonist [Streptomyces sp. AK02-01A]|uniref:anti-sigma factor antagonist n=1 Tax=Streptomyces sp. AK02-01A TaxID=3028648 RepID=UPI0029B2C17E|nr:anti-sigma factor antagonist [Streptomyces sp. AK02-01A]MDX3853734.1 anti-sigma factor antagonist [Streptomyces sp. AK02-01A]
MTIEWRYTTYDGLGVLSLAGYLGADATARFTGAIGWAEARGTGPVVLDLTDLLGWSAGGQLAVAQAARRLAALGRSLELAAIPADGSLVPDAGGPDVPVHCDLPAALAAHRPGGAVAATSRGETAATEWHTDD